jgi:hypothetical protein
MYEKIKQLADEAVVLQNKDRMDASLREISALCDQAAEPKQRGKKQTEQAAGADTLEGGAQ